MNYYLIIILILLLVFTRFIYIYKKNISKIDYIILFLPTIISIYLIGINLKKDYNIPYGDRYVDYKAESIRYYPCQKDKYGNNIEKGYYSLIYDNDKEVEISKNTFYYFAELWNKNKLDSIKYLKKQKKKYLEINWDNNIGHALIYTKTENFINYFSNTLHLYDIKNISYYKANELGLYHRSKLYYINSDNIFEPRQSLIYGIKVNDSISRSFSYLSSIDKMFCPKLLIWIDKEGTNADLIKLQKDYWDYGKDNEIIFCVGIDGIDSRNIKWSGSFSWSNNKQFENFVLENSLQPNTKLDLEKYQIILKEGYDNNLWEPKNFDAYKIKMPLNNILVITISIITILINLLLVYKYFKNLKTLNIDNKK